MACFQFQNKPPKSGNKWSQNGSFESLTDKDSYPQRKWALTPPIWPQLIFEMFVLIWSLEGLRLRASRRIAAKHRECAEILAGNSNDENIFAFLEAERLDRSEPDLHICLNWAFTRFKINLFYLVSLLSSTMVPLLLLATVRGIASCNTCFLQGKKAH